MDDKDAWKFLKIVIVVAGFIALAVGVRAGWALGTHYFDARDNARAVNQ